MRARLVAPTVLGGIVVLVAASLWLGDLQATEGGHRLANYDALYDQCGAAEIAQRDLQRAKDLAAPQHDPAQQAHLDAEVAAARQRLDELVNQYNAAAAGAGSWADFRASGLPSRIAAGPDIACTG